MTTQDMLKLAVSNLRQAAQLRKQEVEDLRKDLANRDQQYKDQINDMRTQQAQRLSESSQSNDDLESANKAREASLLQAQESQAKSSFEQIKRDTDALIVIKQRNVDEINQMAQSIERDWYSL